MATPSKPASATSIHHAAPGRGAREGPDHRWRRLRNRPRPPRSTTLRPDEVPARAPTTDGDAFETDRGHLDRPRYARTGCPRGPRPPIATHSKPASATAVGRAAQRTGPAEGPDHRYWRLRNRLRSRRRPVARRRAAWSAVRASEERAAQALATTPIGRRTRRAGPPDHLRRRPHRPARPGRAPPRRVERRPRARVTIRRAGERPRRALPATHRRRRTRPQGPPDHLARWRRRGRGPADHPRAPKNLAA